MLNNYKDIVVSFFACLCIDCLFFMAMQNTIPVVIIFLHVLLHICMYVLYYFLLRFDIKNNTNSLIIYIMCNAFYFFIIINISGYSLEDFLENIKKQEFAMIVLPNVFAFTLFVFGIIKTKGGYQ